MADSEILATKKDLSQVEIEINLLEIEIKK